MKCEKLLAIISRNFMEFKKVNRYRTKKIADMTDTEIITVCHFYCEETNLVDEWEKFRENAEAEYYYCSYLKEYIDEGLCYDLQMITENCIKSSILPEITVDKEECAKCCSECKYCL